MGVINGAYFAARPDEKGLRNLTNIWAGMRSQEIFPFSLWLIEKATNSTLSWIDGGGLEQVSIPKTLSPHHHKM